MKHTCGICGKEKEFWIQHKVYTGKRWKYQTGAFSKKIPTGKTSGIIAEKVHHFKVCKNCELKWGRAIPGVILLPIPILLTAFTIFILIGGGPIFILLASHTSL